MKKSINRIISGLSEVTELPLNEMCQRWEIAVSGRGELTAEGVVSIKKYTAEAIVLSFCRGEVCIVGRGLWLKSYYHGSLRIVGEICLIDYGGGDDGSA